MKNETGKADILERVKSSAKMLFHIRYYISAILSSLNLIEHRLAQTDCRLDIIEHSNRETKDTLDYILHDEGSFVHGFTDRLLRNRDEMKNLNRELSIVPTLWGNPERLHLSPLASVHPCLFNTNSGEITIGDYTFAGSRVSILAGSHDYRLTGLLRRDSELTEGCDITIGKGVWLGSGCTILGPCTIGDNAVIAAGAVVTPGTIVPANSIYGGIPAKEIGRLSIKQGYDSEAPEIKEAFERANGSLFIEGWTEKQLFPGVPGVGHFLTGTGRIYVKQTEWVIYYGIQNLQEGKKGTILFQGSKGVIQVNCEKETGREVVLLPCSGQEAEVISVDFSPPESRLFLMITPVSEDE